MRGRAGTLALLMALAGLASAADVVEPRTGVRFPDRVESMSLLGTGVRTRTLLKVKVYAVGLYVSDEALRGALRGKAGPALSRDIVWGDFPKRLVLHFVRNASPDQIRDGFIEALPQIPRPRIDVLVSHFPATRRGQQYAFQWAPGGVLQTTVLGKRVPDIVDKEFAAAVFGIWLGERPIQEDIRRDLVARVPVLIR